MTCARCGGLVVTEYGARRCVNCGHDPDLVLRPPNASEAGEATTCRCGNPSWPGKSRCRECLDAGSDESAFYRAIKKGMTTMPRFKTEEGKQRWLAAMAKRRGQKREGGGTTAVARARPTALTVAASHTIDAEASAVVDLDAAIAKRRDELAVLERAKDIVLGG